MKYRGIFEYEYPIEHKTPVGIDVHLHGDCVKGKIIEWEYRPLEQEPTTKNDLGVDYIPRIEVIDYLCKHCPDDGECFKDCDEIKHLRNMSSVTPQEPRKGYWEVVSDGYSDNAYICECSECKDTVWVYKDADRKWNYCPNCGADMRRV